MDTLRHDHSIYLLQSIFVKSLVAHLAIGISGYIMIRAYLHKLNSLYAHCGFTSACIQGQDHNAHRSILAWGTYVLIIGVAGATTSMILLVSTISSSKRSHSSYNLYS